MRKDGSGICDGKGLEGGYINRALSETDLVDSSDSLASHREISGSSDLVLVEEPGAGQDESSSRRTREGLASACLRELRRRCTRKTLHKRLPVLDWLPRYSGQDALGDLVAGVTVGLTVIPQSLAYANVAGLPPQYGLYGSFLGCFVYIVLGSCKDVPFGPTAMVSLLTYQTVAQLPSPEQHAVLLSFLVGCVQLLMGCLGLGFLVDFVSGPVSSGFTSAVALIIVSSQVKDILGIPAQGTTFLQLWTSIARNAHQASGYDAALGLCCIGLLLALRVGARARGEPRPQPPLRRSRSLSLSPSLALSLCPAPAGGAQALAAARIGSDEQQRRSARHRAANRLLWLTGTSRNALLVVGCGLLAYSFPADESPFQLIGHIPGGMPAARPPPPLGGGNGTALTLVEMCANLGSGVLVLPLVALLEDVAICKAFASGRSVDATQELLALGAANLANSFVQAFPGSGSLSRSAVNNASGARTPLGGAYTGALVVLALLFLTPCFAFIPKAALAAIIIAAVVFMVEVKVVKPMWRTKKSDLIPGLGTFVACLVLQVELGIAIGVAVNVLFILYHAARPKISVEKLQSRRGASYLMLTPDRCLIFPSVDYVRHLVTKYGRREAVTPVVIDCTHIYGADFSAAKVVESLTEDFAARGQPLFFYNLKPSVYAVFEGVAPKDFVVYYTQEGLDDLLKERALACAKRAP
ncbi:sodium-independent sulfate anion transporter-like isoform X2 [Phymastichus coffea]|uniref:sodium-independent sulfate anion transporter-like isoform X2 n=1 Tax=Phymastichus coffea TaxID=108790 RepID=UPI00273CA4CC|nr:sodium-independent sulfate anion transporter-like isoform X2 [Phymastichus coffea]XP_058806508.1 sodium-independent sulfate anion transporter-like isoform X2 [Phymastichus coffea]XP_058806509.1 sodium-independent sulfate anion transporter-like isoform X2 [Phymastichus coffea]XP_058806510.1 sodium-independent sulfate anion transporter-like isoform X2 [Phymastichus coffea]